MTMKLAQVPPVGAPRPYATHYYNRVNEVGVPSKIGHCASRKGAVVAAVKRLSTLDLEQATAKNVIVRVEIYDDLGVRCNTVQRSRGTVTITGYY